MEAVLQTLTGLDAWVLYVVLGLLVFGESSAVVALLLPGEVALLVGGALASGVGYLLKDRVMDVAEFLAAVERVGTGGVVIDPEVVQQLLGRRRHADRIDTLTPREREVLALMAEGHNNARIAESLVVTGGAVEKHVRNIFTKLGLDPSDATNRRVLAVLAYLNA